MARQSFHNASGGLEVQIIQSHKGLCEIGCMTYRSSQPSQQKLGIDIRLSRKDPWNKLWSNRVSPCETWETHQVLEILIEEEYSQLVLKGTERRNERRWSDS